MLEANQPGPTDYTSTTTPEGYVCRDCGTTGVKLWRLYNTFLNHQKLLCAVCAAKLEGENIDDIDADGRHTTRLEMYQDEDNDKPSVHHVRGDQIGNMIPAVPDEEGETYWGYTSVPTAGVDWWQRLPTLPTK